MLHQYVLLAFVVFIHPDVAPMLAPITDDKHMFLQAKKLKDKNQIVNAVIQRVKGELVVRTENPWLTKTVTRKTEKIKGDLMAGVILEDWIILHSSYTHKTTHTHSRIGHLGT